MDFINWILPALFSPITILIVVIIELIKFFSFSRKGKRWRKIAWAYLQCSYFNFKRIFSEEPLMMFTGWDHDGKLIIISSVKSGDWMDDKTHVKIFFEDSDRLKEEGKISV